VIAGRGFGPEHRSFASAKGIKHSKPGGYKELPMSTHREIARKPTTPGEILDEDVLKPFGMSQKERG
jgi:hypothetical protein